MRGNFADGVNRIGRGCAHGRADEAGNLPGVDVGRDLLLEQVRPHGEVFVYRNLRRLSEPMPAIFIAFSTEEWVWVEQ